MKKYFGILFIALAIAGVSCKKDSDNPTGGSGGVFKATIDGQVRSTSNPTFALNSGMLNISGAFASGGMMSITVQNFTAPGTFTIGGGNMHMGMYWPSARSNDQYVASGILGTGTITVTAYSANNVKGTFNFTGYNNAQQSKAVTNGEFDISK